MKSKKTLTLTQLALLVALELIVAYTPLGYLSVPGLTITFLMVPVSLGGILLGPSAGAILGGVFGITSFIQCFGASPFGAALLSINPVTTFITCVIPRIIAGVIPALVFKALYSKKQNLSFFAAALSGSLANTVFFMLFLIVCFFGTEYIQTMALGMGTANPIVFAALFVGVQGIIEAVVCCVLSGVICKVAYPAIKRRS